MSEIHPITLYILEKEAMSVSSAGKYIKETATKGYDAVRSGGSKAYKAVKDGGKNYLDNMSGKKYKDALQQSRRHIGEAKDSAVDLSNYKPHIGGKGKIYDYSKEELNVLINKAKGKAVRMESSINKSDSAKKSRNIARGGTALGTLGLAGGAYAYKNRKK